jgi:serine/threonine protein phosphatase PrpC
MKEHNNMSKSSKIRLEAAAGSDLGQSRRINQDAVFQWISDQDLDPPRALLLLADGMGGHQEGEVASQLAVDMHKEIVLPKLSKKMIEGVNLTELLESALHSSNQAIHDYAIDNDIIPQDIGTTLDCVVVLGVEVFVSHIGDGRVYILEKHGLNQVTEDHSAVAEMVEAGIITPDEIYTHPQRNILTQGLGGNTKANVEVERFDLSVGERILVCSDGLWGIVRDPLLERIMLWASPPHILVKELVIAANQAGSNDNISVIICDILPAK